MPKIDLQSSLCAEADELLPMDYPPITDDRIEEIRQHRLQHGYKTSTRSQLARQARRPISSQRVAKKETAELERTGVKKPGLTAEDLSTLPTQDALSTLRPPPTEAASSAKSKVAPRPTRSWPYEGMGLGQTGTAKPPPPLPPPPRRPSQAYSQAHSSYPPWMPSTTGASSQKAHSAPTNPGQSTTDGPTSSQALNLHQPPGSVGPGQCSSVCDGIAA